MGLWVVSTFLLLWVMLLWTLVYKYLFESHLSLLVRIYPRMGSLEHMKVYVLLFEKQPNCFPQFSSVTQSSPTLYDPMDRSMPGSLSITNSWSLLKFMSIKSLMPSKSSPSPPVSFSCLLISSTVFFHFNYYILNLCLVVLCVFLLYVKNF